MLSRQALLNCVPGPSSVPPGCNGGDAWMVHEYLERSEVPDETCQPYEARNGVCTPTGQCRNCLPLASAPDRSPGCLAVPSYVGYGVAEYGSVRGEAAMRKEILARGPIVCSLVANERFAFNYSGVALRHDGVYVDETNPQSYGDADVDHEVEITGWGVTPTGLPYWVVRNSWGTYWGEAGWARVRRGVNQQRIESECYWAVPTFDELEAVTSPASLGSVQVSVGRDDGATDAPREHARHSSHAQHHPAPGGTAREGSPTRRGAAPAPDGLAHSEGWPNPARASPPPRESPDEQTWVRDDERGGQTSTAGRVPLLGALLLAAVAMTAASALSMSLLKKDKPPQPQDGPPLDAPFVAAAERAEISAPTPTTYQPPPLEPYDWADYQPLEGTPPTRWKVRL